MDDQSYRMATELRDRLRAELERNETYRALRHIEAVLALHEPSRPASPISPTPRPNVVHRHIPGSNTAKIVESAAKFLRGRGTRATSSEIYRVLAADGIEVKGKDPAKVLSSHLSHSPLFNNVPGQGYGLAEWPVTGEMPAPRESKAPTKGDQMWEAIRNFLKARGSAHRLEILNHLISEGFVTSGPKAMATVAAFLSERRHLLARQGVGYWSLAPDEGQTNEAPNSGELFGASRGNGAEPLHP